MQQIESSIILLLARSFLSHRTKQTRRSSRQCRDSAELVMIRIISPHSVASVSVFVEDLARDKCDERLLLVRAAAAAQLSTEG